MKLFQFGLILIALLSLMSLSQAYLFYGNPYGQQSINSNYYYVGQATQVVAPNAGAWTYYGYNTFDPYPTLGGGLFFPSQGYSYSYSAPYPSYGYGGGYGYGGYAPVYGAASDFSYNNGYCTFWC